MELGTLFGAVALSNGGPRAAHDLQELSERTQMDRERGFVLAVEEFEHGTTEISAPIAAPGGSILASVSVALASTASEDHQRVVRLLLSMASELAEQLCEQVEDDEK
ncbi:Bacterial transcriptional regulator [Microbacterium azadirachtae]|uniref:Bacterial transcriptional regulator n=1 Tax=Microbacterium azadirachtae TaxID=582680 RepID=A0A0F0LBZ5_9MICO|nr:Bacterial transcriptional regulator [Microbacterium azadirachtae]